MLTSMQNFFGLRLGWKCSTIWHLSTFFWKKNLPFHLENTSSLTHNTLLTILTNKIIRIFMLKLSYKTHELYLMHFQNEMGHLFFFQMEEI